MSVEGQHEWQYPDRPLAVPPVVEVGAGHSSLRLRSVCYQRGQVSHPHRHRWAQLLYAHEGSMTVQTTAGIWFVPPGRAVWIPAMQEHSVEFVTNISMSNFFFERRPTLADTPNECKVVRISPLFHHTIRYLVAFEADPENTVFEVFSKSMLHLLCEASTEPFKIAMPVDKRLQILFEALFRTPSDRRTVGNWAELLGVSKRTLSRRIKYELGSSFTIWRQQIRLFAALEMLERGRSITEVSFEVGFSSTSAFISTFKKFFGVTPRNYLRNEMPCV